MVSTEASEPLAFKSSKKYFTDHKLTNMETLKFKTNINCSGCIAAVTPHLNSVDEVALWKVNTQSPEKVLEVEAEAGAEALILQAVKKAGFEIEPLT
jgi:copper chaperone